MEKISPQYLQEVLFSSSDPRVSRQWSAMEKAGTLRKIAPRIYTPNLTDSPEVIIKRNLFTILGRLYPGAVLSHRSALEFTPTSLGHVFLTYTYTRKISLPGLTLRLMEGPGPIEGDRPFSGELYVSQMERALLENLEVSRKPGPESKTLTRPELEERLEQIIRVKGEAALNTMRDKAKAIAEQLHMQTEFEKLNALISAVLSTRPAKILMSPVALARALGYPYDPARITLFEKLFVGLKQQPYRDWPELNTSPESFRSFAFFEAYFSNYIEGTEFELEEAIKIVETETPLPSRHEDSHDILGTYSIISNRNEMLVTPQHAEDLLRIILYRHEILLKARPSKNPGQFKDKNNRAGETHFVDHTLVKGTLIKGFDYYQALDHPFARAGYMMFMISEVHPFTDGNGRIARVMMNAELVKQGQSKIIIPTVYRDDYLGAMRKLTRKGDVQSYIRMLLRAQEFSATIAGKDIETMQKKLEASNAFKEHDVAPLIIQQP